MIKFFLLNRRFTFVSVILGEYNNLEVDSKLCNWHSVSTFVNLDTVPSLTLCCQSIKIRVRKC